MNQLHDEDDDFRRFNHDYYDRVPQRGSQVLLEVERYGLRAVVDGQPLCRIPFELDDDGKGRIECYLNAVREAWFAQRAVWEKSRLFVEERRRDLRTVADDLGRALHTLLFGGERARVAQALTERIANDAQRSAYTEIILSSEELYLRELPWEATYLPVGGHAELSTRRSILRDGGARELVAPLGELPFAAFTVVRPGRSAESAGERFPNGARALVEELVSSAGQGLPEDDPFELYRREMFGIYGQLNQEPRAMYEFRTRGAFEAFLPPTAVDVGHVVGHASRNADGRPAVRLSGLDTRLLGRDTTAEQVMSVIGVPRGLMVLWVCGERDIHLKEYPEPEPQEKANETVSVGENFLDFVPTVLTYDDGLPLWGPRALTPILYHYLLRSGAIDHAVQQLRRSLRFALDRLNNDESLRIDPLAIRLRTRRPSHLDYLMDFIVPYSRGYWRGSLSTLRQPAEATLDERGGSKAATSASPNIFQTALHAFPEPWPEETESVRYPGLDCGPGALLYKVKVCELTPGVQVIVPKKGGPHERPCDLTVTLTPNFGDPCQVGDHNNSFIWLSKDILNENDVRPMDPLESKHPSTAGHNQALLRWLGPIGTHLRELFEGLIQRNGDDQWAAVFGEDGYKDFNYTRGLARLAEYIENAKGEQRDFIHSLARHTTRNHKDAPSWLSRHPNLASSWLFHGSGTPATRLNFLVLLHAAVSGISLVELLNTPGNELSRDRFRQRYRWYPAFNAMIRGLRSS